MIDLHDMRKGIAAARAPRLKGHTKKAVDRISSAYEDQALPSELGEGPAENFAVATLIPIVLNLLSALCPGLGGAPPPASQTAQAMKNPTKFQDNQHWKACVKASRQEIVDSEIGSGKPGRGRHLKQDRKDWKQRQKVLRAALTETQDDAALRTYHANNEASANSTIQELTAMVEERRAAV
jgi:hypothetical protein